MIILICILIFLCITQLFSFGALFYLKHEMYWTNEWHRITTDLVGMLLQEIHPEFTNKDEEEEYIPSTDDAEIALKILRHGLNPCQYCQIQNRKIDGGAFHAACNTCGKMHENFIFDPDAKEKEEDSQ